MGSKGKRRKGQAGGAQGAGKTHGKGGKNAAGGRPDGGAGKTAAVLKGSGRNWTAGLFFLCLIAYVLNGDFDPGQDQQGNMLFSVNLLKYHSFALTPERAPNAFVWAYGQGDEAKNTVDIKEWNARLHEMYQKGDLQPSNRYYLTPTKRENWYANTFGMGTAIVGLPVYALLNLFVDIDSDQYWWWYGSKLSASLLIAAAAVFIFLAAGFLVAPLPAFLVAISFALGSCVWTTSSQALWQHPANTFFLALGAYFLCGMAARKHFALYCGAALGMAVLCRPPSAIVVLCVGLYLLVVNRRWLLQYLLGGIPIALALGMYNLYYFDDLFFFGQIAASQSIALQKTGVAEIWQTPLWLGLGGLLFSPSRGLLFFSPVLFFGFVGAAMAWKKPQYAPLIPVQIAVLLLLLVAAKWFDWWGGFAFGYRPIVDTTVFLALCMAPVMEKIIHTRWPLRCFVVLLCWSIYVQIIGAYSYNGASWNYKNQMNIDVREHQHRLWSLRDNQLHYYSTHFGAARRQKHGQMNAYTRSPMPVVVHPPLQ